jgi:hypothetical protein
MSSASPGSWADLLWRLRAEVAAAEADDFAALAALAAGATITEPPPDLAAAAEAIHLHERLVRIVVARIDDVQRRMALLSSLLPPDAVKLDLRF